MKCFQPVLMFDFILTLPFLVSIELSTSRSLSCKWKKASKQFEAFGVVFMEL